MVACLHARRDTSKDPVAVSAIFRGRAAFRSLSLCYTLHGIRFSAPLEVPGEQWVVTTGTIRCMSFVRCTLLYALEKHQSVSSKGGYLCSVVTVWSILKARMQGITERRVTPGPMGWLGTSHADNKTGMNQR